MPRQSHTAETGCPFLEKDDPRCASHFSLKHLDEAFDVCVNGHRACPMYYRMLREQNLGTTLTLRGQPFITSPTLRKTGS
ncbi:MAG: hypothetical protein WD768_18835 [Phycisphaeraceae bacterium]